MSFSTSRGLTLLAAILATAALSAGCGSTSSAPKLNGDGYSGVDTANTRFVKGGINRGNATSLKTAWTVPLTGQSTYGSFASTPVVANGVMYGQDLESNVLAVNLEDGSVIWSKKYASAGPGPNGIVVADGRVYGATITEAFALDQETGRELWSTPLIHSSSEGIDMTPGYHDGLVYFSTVPFNAALEYAGGVAGTLWALDAKTGKKVWHFNTVPPSLWGDKSVNGGGGLWYAPSFDKKGFMYFGVGNPAPYPGTASKPWGSSRPGPNLYTDSLIKMDAKTGKMDWHYQQTPHDVYDWDFQDPPILVSSKGRELVIGAGKSGVVVALDAQTGKPVWKRPVGIHNGHDQDGLYAMSKEYGKLKEGVPVFPGALGGAIAPMASNSKTLFVPVLNHAYEVTPQNEVAEATDKGGELVAIDIATGKIKWKKNYPTGTFGAPIAVNDMVFVATFDSTVHGLDADTGGEVWQGSLPAASNAGLMASGDTLLVPAGVPLQEGQKPEIVAFRTGG